MDQARTIAPGAPGTGDGAESLLAEEQAALRRVATLVASGADAAEIFGAVAEEAGRLLHAASSATIRYDDDAAVTVGRWNDGDPPASPSGRPCRSPRATG